MKITNRLIKFLVILNGLLLPVLLLFALYQITKELYTNKNHYPDGVILGEKLEEAKKDSVALQGLRYYSPISIYNSENKLLKISLLTYQEEKKLKEAASVANDIGDPSFNLVNIVFLDKNYQVIGSLVDKKASILKIEFKGNYYYEDKPIDKTYRYIGYLIAFEDTNKDGKLNSKDNHDLYISDLSGKNLKKITNNIDIDSFEFINSNSQIFIHYKERKNIPEEHKKIKFAVYDIIKASFVNLESLNSELDKLEKVIIN